MGLIHNIFQSLTFLFLEDTRVKYAHEFNAIMYSGPCDERPPLLQSMGGLSWGCGLLSGCKMYKKYYLVRTRGGHIRQVSLSLGGLCISKFAIFVLHQNATY